MQSTNEDKMAVIFRFSAESQMPPERERTGSAKIDI